MPKFFESRMEELEMKLEVGAPFEVQLIEYMALSEDCKRNLTFRDYCDYQDKSQVKRNL